MAAHRQRRGGGRSTFTVLTQPANGTLTSTAPNLTYTPNANHTGPDSFTFRLTTACSTRTWLIGRSVTADNQPPLASDATAKPRPRTRRLESRFRRPTKIRTHSRSPCRHQPVNGTLSGLANLTYTPDANFSGTDSFTFVANDSMANSNGATISIVVGARE
ncbi:MAG: Ig-like domain-containing protein [Pirellulaceae bacterium]